MIIHVKRIDPIRVAYMRAVGPYPKIFPELWKTFCDEAMKRHLFKPDAMYISLCNDDPGRVPEDQLRGDACVSVSADFKPDETIKLQTIAGGEYAIGEYKGPYTGLQKAWGEFCAAVSAGGDLKYRAMPSFEVYLSDPKTCPPEELRTDMYVAVERLTA